MSSFCLEALSTSEMGCFALRSSCPTPFIQPVTLLYSDKNMGNVVTQQLIIDLLMILFELYPPLSLPSVGSVLPRLYSLLRSLMLAPTP